MNVVSSFICNYGFQIGSMSHHWEFTHDTHASQNLSFFMEI